MEDELYRLARVKAAERSTSISAIFKTFLIQLTASKDAETRFQRLQREEQELRAELSNRGLGPDPAYNLNRDEVHDRQALR